MKIFVNMVDNFRNFWFADNKAGRGEYVPLNFDTGVGC
jgi:hypothetical protein